MNGMNISVDISEARVELVKIFTVSLPLKSPTTPTPDLFPVWGFSSAKIDETGGESSKSSTIIRIAFFDEI